MRIPLDFMLSLGFLPAVITRYVSEDLPCNCSMANFNTLDENAPARPLSAPTTM